MNVKEVPPSWDAKATVTVARTGVHADVLGPGNRAVVWVKGCPFRCPGCCSPDTLAFKDGEVIPIADLARGLAALEDVEGVTLSGGEPFAQAASLARLIDELHAQRPDLSTMSYSGYTLAQLKRLGASARALLDRLDILVDGQYVEGLHGDLRWRGSSNQQLHFLTPRYAELAKEADRSAGVEIWIDTDQVRWVGVPAVPRFRPGLEGGMASRGVVIRRRRGGPTL
jgi:anaerobic ribonucleoside-triphosphate reductase activating protein